MSATKLKGRSLVIRLDRDEMRVALMVLGAAMPTVIHSVSLPVPAGAVDDGFIAQPDVVRELLSTALLEPQFKKCRTAVFSLCTTQVISETVTTPEVPAARLGKMLVPDFHGGQYTQTVEYTLRVKDVFAKNLTAGDILLWQTDSVSSIEVAVHDGENLYWVTNGSLQIMDQPMLDKFFIYRWFAAIRPLQGV